MPAASSTLREVQWSNLQNRHRQQIGVQVGGLLAVSLNGFPGQLSFRILREEVLQQFRQRLRNKADRVSLGRLVPGCAFRRG
jgi:hypothetical protein